MSRAEKKALQNYIVYYIQMDLRLFSLVTVIAISSEHSSSKFFFLSLILSFLHSSVFLSNSSPSCPSFFILLIIFCIFSSFFPCSFWKLELLHTAMTWSRYFSLSGMDLDRDLDLLRRNIDWIIRACLSHGWSEGQQKVEGAGCCCEGGKLLHRGINSERFD